MADKINIKGDTYYRLTVVDDSGEHLRGKTSVTCRCLCGNVVKATKNALRTGNIKSCGCLHKEGSHTTHGLSKDPLYPVWCGIKQRCKDKRNSNYGGRGIDVCEDWKNDFAKFRNWALSMGWERGLDVDRFPNMNGNYEPNNCRIVSRKINCRNTRKVIFITHGGITKSLPDWADDLKIKVGTLSQRIFKLEMPLDRALQSTKYKRWQTKS